MPPLLRSTGLSYSCEGIVRGFKYHTAASRTMVELEWRTASRGTVSFVAATLDNRRSQTGVDAHEVHADVRIDGELWPPCVDGHPAPEWDDDALQVTVPVGSTRGIGAAGRGTFGSPPIEIVHVEPAEGGRSTPDSVDVLRALGDPTPPREAIPIPRGESTTVPATEDRPGNGEDTHGDGSGWNVHSQERSAGDPSKQLTPGESENTDRERSTGELSRIAARDGKRNRSRAPAPVERWLGAVEQRLDRATRAERAADREHLARVRKRSEELLDSLNSSIEPTEPAMQR